MNERSSQFDTNRRREPLDDLLNQAHWPEPTNESSARLLDAWDACAPANRRRSLLAVLPAFMGAAAAIVIAVGAAFLVIHRPNRTISHVVPVRRSTAPSTIHAAPREPDSVLHVVSRPATPYERWAVLYLPDGHAPHPLSAGNDSSRAHQNSPPDATPAVAAQAQILVLRVERMQDTAARRQAIAGWLSDGSPVLLDAAIRALADPRLRNDAWAAATSAPAPSADLLMAHFDDLHADYRFAAARLLGRSCDAGHRQTLERMVRLNDHRREALAALLCCPDAQASRFLDQLEPNRSFNAQIRSARAQVERLCS